MCSIKKIIFFCGGNIKNMRALNHWCCVRERVATFEFTNKIIAKTVLIYKGQNWFEQDRRTVLTDWQVKLTDSAESFLWIWFITHRHRDIEAFKIFDSNVRGNLQVLRTWLFHYKTEKEEAKNWFVGYLCKIVHMFRDSENFIHRLDNLIAIISSLFNLWAVLFRGGSRILFRRWCITKEWRN